MPVTCAIAPSTFKRCPVIGYTPAGQYGQNTQQHLQQYQYQRIVLAVPYTCDAAGTALVLKKALQMSISKQIRQSAMKKWMVIRLFKSSAATGFPEHALWNPTAINGGQVGAYQRLLCPINAPPNTSCTNNNAISHQG